MARMKIQSDLEPGILLSPLRRLWESSARKILAIEASLSPGASAPVYTVEGTYTARGWTEWMSFSCRCRQKITRKMGSGKYP